MVFSMSAPTVYLLVPVHNRRDITVQFAKEIAAQTYDNLVFILIDDGSTDSTAEGVRDVCPDVKVIEADGNLWWAGSLQKGLDYIHDAGANDEDIVIMSNDDVILDEKFVQTGVDLLASKPGSLLLPQHRETVDAAPKETGVFLNRKTLRIEVASSPDKINCLSTRGLFLTWKTTKEIGGFYTRILSHYGSDYEWTARAGRKGFKLWTNPSLSLVPMPEQTGHRSTTGKPTLSELMTHFFSKRSTSNIFMRSVLYALTGSPPHVPRILLHYWYVCAKQAGEATVRSLVALVGLKKRPEKNE